MPELDIHLRGGSFLTLWQPADPRSSRRPSTPRLLWVLILRVPHAHQKHAGWSMPVTGLAPATTGGPDDC